VSTGLRFDGGSAGRRGRRNTADKRVGSWLIGVNGIGISGSSIGKRARSRLLGGINDIRARTSFRSNSWRRLLFCTNLGAGSEGERCRK
jgi:hypothetical protein